MSIFLNEFLAFLEDDIAARPETVLPLASELEGRIVALTADIPACLTEKSEGPVAL